MQFEWDEEKRQEIIRERDVDILFAALIFENPVLVRVDDRKDYGEERFAALGHVDGEFFTLIYTQRGIKTRLITAWPITAGTVGKNGEKEYKECIAE